MELIIDPAEFLSLLPLIDVESLWFVHHFDSKVYLSYRFFSPCG